MCSPISLRLLERGRSRRLAEGISSGRRLCNPSIWEMARTDGLVGETGSGSFKRISVSFPTPIFFPRTGYLSMAKCFRQWTATGASVCMFPGLNVLTKISRSSQEAKCMALKESQADAAVSSGRLWSFAGREFDESRLELRVHGELVELELKPLEILLQLLLHAGKVVTKDQLLDAVWPGLTVVEGS